MQIIIPTVVVKDTGTEKGRGVYAAKNFSKNEVIERCPVITFGCDFDDLPDNLKTRVFDWYVLANHTDDHAIALGMGSLYNHSNPSNLRFEAVGPNYLQFVAVQDIAEGSELTINYNGYKGSHICEDDNWFQRTGITPIA